MFDAFTAMRLQYDLPAYPYSQVGQIGHKIGVAGQKQYRKWPVNPSSASLGGKNEAKEEESSGEVDDLVNRWLSQANTA